MLGVAAQSPSQLYSQALELKKSQRCDLALPVFSQAMQTTRSAQDKALELLVLRHRGECYQYQGDYALAWLDLAYGQLLAPEKALFYEALGWLAIFEGDYDTAQGQLKQAELIEPQNPWVQLNLGWAYYLKGDTVPAFKLWTPLLQNPQNIYREALQREIVLLQSHTTQAEEISQNTFAAVKLLLKNTALQTFP
jgi:tetratricopeptide (TPR) repeat protein